jgi:polyphosphate kinase
MTRNLDSRVEAVAPVEDPEIREQLRFVLELMGRDNRKCWEMNADGTYEQRQPGPGEPEISTQTVLADQARRAATDDEIDRGIPADAFDETTLLVDAVGSDSERRSADDGGDAAVGDSDDGSDAVRSASEPTGMSVETDGAATVAETDGAASTVATNGDLPTALSANPGAWYRPDSDHYAFAVRTPDGTVYRKTADGAASAIERYRD